MATIVIADDGLVFDGGSLEAGPLGGAETAVVCLAEALAARGHRVTVCNRCAGPLDHKGVRWRSLADLPDAADLYIANRGHRLIGQVPRAGSAAFWLHNPARYIAKPRYVWPLVRRRPALMVTSRYHAGTVPRWIPGRRVVVPLAVADAIRTAPPAVAPPPPRALFLSNPLRGLDWLLARWRGIRARVPAAELQVLAGAAVYGGAGKHAAAIEAVLARARAVSGVAVRPPVPKDQVALALAAARVMLYRGDPEETFCLAVAEAQAMGVPAVVQAIGALPERVVDGATGTVAADDAGFEAAAVALLSDDALWRHRHEACLALQRRRSWDDVARDVEGLMRRRQGGISAKVDA